MHGDHKTHLQACVRIEKTEPRQLVFPSSSEDDTAVNYGEAGASLICTQREAKRKLRDWME